MILAGIAFSVGVVSLQLLPSLPTPSWLLLSLFLLPLFYVKPLRPLLWLLSGLVWACFIATLHLDDRLSHDLDGATVLLEAEVIGLPKQAENNVRFVLQTDRHANQENRLPARIRLSWFHGPKNIAPGQRWRLLVKLKRPHGFQNPGGFDYEQWLLTEGIGATGYVKRADINQLIGTDSGPSLDAVRYQLRSSIADATQELSTSALMLGLTLGDRSAMTQEQWQILRRTGTSHLLAISGLHIGLIAGIFYFLTRRLWLLFPALLLWLPANKAASLLGLLAAVVYAALAGFALPTIRALIMLAVVVIAIVWNRPLRIGHTLLLALLAVLLVDPLSSFSAGFWLSFVAVAVILLALMSVNNDRPKFFSLLKIQWFLLLGLAPLTIVFFQMVSLAGLLTNLVAIPVVGFLVVPLLLLATACLWFSESLALVFYAWADALLSQLFAALHWASELNFSMLYLAVDRLWVLLIAMLAAVLLLLPRGVPFKWPAVIFILPLLLGSHQPKLAEGDFKVTVLDVGMGEAVVVRTSKHLLLFDAGPRWRSGFDAGESVLLPYLRENRIDHIDHLMLSHGDNDHAGGAHVIVKNMPVSRITSGTPEQFPDWQVSACLAGQSWRWDEVQFSVLHPSPGYKGNDNNRSCVLKIESVAGSVLLTGDIQAAAEKQLLKTAADLNSDVLVAPHHGSNTSSTQGFIQAVAPTMVVFPVGFHNQWGFPQAEVLQRYTDIQAEILRTDQQGAVQIDVSRLHGITAGTYRANQPRFWY